MEGREMRNTMLKNAAAAAAALLLCCCNRIEILDTTSNYKVEISINRESILYKAPDKIENVAVMLYDPNSYQQTLTNYFKSEGGYLTSGIKPGDYIMMCYNIDTQSSTMRRTDYINYTYVSTGTPRTTETGEKIYNEPDHIFISTDNVRLPVIAEKDGEHVTKIYPRSICDSWRLIVNGVKGTRWARSANMFIGNQRTAYSLLERRYDGEEIMHHEMMNDMNHETDEITCDFCTLGMSDNPDKRIKIQLIFQADNGEMFTEIFDVTDQVRDPQNARHIIEIEYNIEMKKNEEGGIRPSSTEWDDIIYIVDIK